MIERVLKEHLQSNTEMLGPHLASYNGELAVFNQEAPSDKSAGWSKGSQYGRIVFSLDLTNDPERKYSGSLAVDVLCEDGKQIPEELEAIVRPLIDGYFFSEEDITIAAQWNTSNYFTEPTNKVVGVTLTFNLLAFEKQTTIEPDPIALLNKWTSTELKQRIGRNIRVIGYEALEAAWKPSNEEPAIYWRLSAINPCSWIPDTYNCSWHTAVVFAHIFAKDEHEEATVARMLNNILTIKRRLIFDDMSPLMVDRNIRVNLGSDQFRVGQLTMEATYGILMDPRPYKPVNNLQVKGKEGE